MFKARIFATSLYVILSFIIIFIYFQWTNSTILANLGGDNARYLLIAQYLSPYTSFSEVAYHFAINSQYPPVYPLILALAGGAESIQIAHLITTISLLLAVLIMIFWGTKSGLNKLTTVFCLIVFLILPGTLNQALMILSENTYLLFSVLSLLMIENYENTNEKKWIWITVVFIVLASLTRTAGLSLILAFSVYVYFRRPDDEIKLILSSVLPMLAWKFFGLHQGNGYLPALVNEYSETGVINIFQMFHNELINLWYGWILNFTDNKSHLFITSTIGIFCLFSAFSRARQLKLDGLYILIYLGMILIWPYPAEIIRLIYVIIPILLVQAIILLNNITFSIYNRNIIKILPLVFLIIITIIVMPGTYQKYSRFVFPLPQYIKPYRHSQIWFDNDINKALDGIQATRVLVGSMEKLIKIIPEKECVYSIKPSIIGLYSNRISYAPPNIFLKGKDFDKQLNNTGCKYFFMMYLHSPSYPEAYYPMKRIIEYIDILNIYRMDHGDMYFDVSMIGMYSKFHR